MTGPFVEADALLKAGKVDEALALVSQVIETTPQAAGANVYRNLATMLYRRQRYEDSVSWARAGVAAFPRDFELWNIMGVSLRRLLRYDEALKALSQAEKINPKNAAALVNKGNIYNDQKNGPAAVEVFTKLVRQTPSNAEYQRSLGRGFWYSGDLEKAEMRFNLATRLKPDYLDAWLDLTSLAADREGPSATLAIFDRAIAALPGVLRLQEARGIMIRRTGRLRDAEAYWLEQLAQHGDLGWIHFQLGGTVSDYDRLRANIHLQKAVELEPDNVDYKMALAESLGRTRLGDESDNVERAYGVLKEALAVEAPLTPSHKKVATEILVRVADFDRLDTLGDFTSLGREWANAGKHTALLAHLARVREPQDRVELVAQHRVWGEMVEASLAKRPLNRPRTRGADGKIRLGFMSSDLRAHPVAYFSLPLFEHYDRDRFEIYIYSYYQGQEDRTQARIASLVTGFRWRQDMSDADAAQMIADDELDMLIELGGSTHMNKLQVMAYKPAPLQASWLGYPHSAGLKAIDHLILDPYVTPARPELMIEKPLLMPSSWIAMGELAFPERPITPGTPEERNGFLTFGTANNPYKYSREMLLAWARVTAATPDARFLFVRPEGGAPSFRANVEALFAREGVSADRLRFEDIRGQHMPFYNEIDIALDTFPQTGGTTTCETLWMGVPVVSLVGDGIFERLSNSILHNAGLGDLCARTEDEYLRIALTLAGDRERRAMLRTELRGMLKASPLGQTRKFAEDFFAMIEGAVATARNGKKVAEPA